MSVKLFQNTVEQKPATKVFNGPGRGRKQCPSCKIYIGVRAKLCSCGNSFERKKAVVTSKRKIGVTKKQRFPKRKSGNKLEIPPATQQHSDGVSRNLNMVLAPAGKCPIKLETIEYEDVREWARRVRECGFKRGDYYTSHALAYYAREFHSIFSEEYRVIKEHLKALPRIESEPEL